MTFFRLCIFAGVLTVWVAVLAQSAPPTTNVLGRVLMIETDTERGSVFSIDVDGREYWITAKHILTGARQPPYGSVTAKSISLRILNPGAQGEQWLTERFSVIDTDPNTDIVVLAAAKPLLSSPPPSAAADSSGVLLGGDCEFLGFPYGGGWRARFADGESSWMPFVKHCTISSLVSQNPTIWVLDGINNSGFSGGPVIYQTGAAQKIIAVISGYRLEPTDVIPSTAEQSSKLSETPPFPKATVNLNSGFIIAFDISSAINVIKKNPIGPLTSPAKTN